MALTYEQKRQRLADIKELCDDATVQLDASHATTAKVGEVTMSVAAAQTSAAVSSLGTILLGIQDALDAINAP